MIDSVQRSFSFCTRVSMFKGNHSQYIIYFSKWYKTSDILFLLSLRLNKVSLT